MKNIGMPFDFENTYSHGKRLKFVKEAIEEYCRANNINNKNQIRILDIGCGTGIGITFPLASLGYPIIGVDIDKDSIDWAKKENIYPNVQFEYGYLENLPHLSNFDIIICSEVLEHLVKPKDFLLLLKSRLKVGGILIATVPNGYGWFEFEKFIYEKLKLKYILQLFIKFKKFFSPISSIPLATLNKEDIHLQHFSYLKIKRLFKEAKMTIVKKGRAGIFGGPISEIIFSRFKKWLKLNNLLGDLFPLFSLDWYFVLTNKYT